MSSEVSGRVRPGDILADKYRVDQVLGVGGMGVVVAAEHLDLCERVAIKFLLDDAATDGELAERFLREARAAVKIKSEHVVRIIDVGRLASGSPYMVMEYLEGQDLAQRLEHGRLSIEDSVDYVIQCCEAMNVAHHAGIIHRDLKPANLFLTKRPDGSPIIKVLDFGISKVNTGEAVQLSLTRTQTMMGSPLYMSPEQMRSSKDVDRRTDVWSLGVILHELISGDVPFSGSGFPEVLVKVMTEAAPGLRSLRPEVPAGLEAVVSRCLSKSPADRFSSVAALAVALSPFASARTLSLQSRLRQSLSEPPKLAGPEAGALGETRIEAGVPAPVLPFAGRAGAANAAGTLASRGQGAEASAAGAGQLPLGTHTSWEDASSPSRKPASVRWPVRVALIAGAAACAAGMLTLFRSDPQTPVSPTTAAAPVSTAPTAARTAPEPLPAAVPSAAAAPVAVAAPMVAVVPAAPVSAAPPPEALPKPRASARRQAARAPAARPRTAVPAARPDPPTAAPPPAPKAAPTRSKPLSLEFK